MAEQAQEMVVDATPEKKAFVAKRSTHEDRIKKDEEELKELLKEQTGDTEKEEGTEENQDSTEEKEEPKSAEERTFKKRYGDLRRHSQEKEKEYQKKLQDLEGQLATATKKEMKLPKSDEDIEAWAKEYPDVAKIVETIAIKKAREQSAEIEDRLKKIDEMNLSATKERAEVELLKIHPDFDLSGYKMHYTKMKMMQNLQHEPLISTNLIEAWVRRTQARVARMLLKQLVRKIKQVFQMQLIKLV